MIGGRSAWGRVVACRCSCVVSSFVSAALASALALLAAGCASQAHEQQLAEARALPTEHFAGAVTIKDDALEATATFSTDKGFKEKRGLLGIVAEDQFLRASLDKKTGARTYQVYVAMTYRGDQWREPYQANFGTPLQTVAVKRLHRKAECEKKREYGCIRVEHVGFELPAAEFARVAETATPADMKEKMWVFRLKTRDAKDYNGEIPLAEFAGLKQAMDAHKIVAMR